jgi:hypothetical protein
LRIKVKGLFLAKDAKHAETPQFRVKGNFNSPQRHQEHHNSGLKEKAINHQDTKNTYFRVKSKAFHHGDSEFAETSTFRVFQRDTRFWIQDVR